jgi:hypothetical protein
MCEVSNGQGGTKYQKCEPGNCPCAAAVELPETGEGNYDCDWKCVDGWYSGEVYNDSCPELIHDASSNAVQGNTADGCVGSLPAVTDHDGFSADVVRGSGVKGAMHCLLPKPPTLEVVGDATITLDATSDLDDKYTDDGAKCFDDKLHCAGGAACEISERVTVKGDIVDLNTYGTYVIDYQCTSPTVWSDGSSTCVHTSERVSEGCILSKRIKDGTLQDEEPRVVIVKDETCPTCEFDTNTAPEVVTIEASFPYDASDLAPTCTDDCGFSASSTVCVNQVGLSEPAAVKSSTVDVESTGLWHVTYTIKDGQDNDACVDPIRTVKVIDSLKPIIGLNFGAADQLAHDGGYASTENTQETSQYGKHPEIANPAKDSSFWDESLMSQVADNAWLLAAAGSAVAGVALLALTGARGNTISELV